MKFWNRYPGDYSRDTRHLSLAEHGAYALLLDAYYSSECPLPSDMASLYRICVAFEEAEQRAVDRVADRFFPVAADGLRHNKRADIEIPKAQARIEVAAANGRKSAGRPKKPSGIPENNPVGIPAGLPEVTQRVHSPSASSAPSSSSAPAPDPTPTLPSPSGDSVVSSSKDAKRLAKERLTRITMDAITTWNSSPLVKPLGKLDQVNPEVGFGTWRKRVAECLSTAEDILRVEDDGDLEITTYFWNAYFDLCQQDDYKSGRKRYPNLAADWRPSLDYLIRPSTMLSVYTKSPGTQP